MGQHRHYDALPEAQRGCEVLMPPSAKRRFWMAQTLKAVRQIERAAWRGLWDLPSDRSDEACPWIEKRDDDITYVEWWRVPRPRTQGFVRQELSP
jgi:hypothetical protein